jgi:hypothetical protein
MVGSLYRGSEGAQRKLIPIRIENFKRKGLWAPLAYADIFDFCEPDAKTALLHAVRLPRRLTIKPVFPEAYIEMSDVAEGTAHLLQALEDQLTGVDALRNS